MDLLDYAVIVAMAFAAFILVAFLWAAVEEICTRPPTRKNQQKGVL